MHQNIDITLIDRQDVIEIVDKNQQDIKPSLRWLRFLALALSGAGMLLAVWLLVQESAKRQLIRDFAGATAAGNSMTLILNTDWVSVRQALKQDLKLRFATNPSLPNSREDVEKLVDYYVQPEKVPYLLYFYQQAAGRIGAEAFVRRARFSGLTEITVDIASPPQVNKPWLNHLEPVHAVFQLDMAALNWKLVKIQAPDYLIPTQVPAKKRAA